MFDGLTAPALMSILESVPQANLLAVRLLDQLHPRASSAPLDDAELARLVEATAELMAYTTACQEASRRLHRLPPIPLDVSIPEYGL